jgi:transcriptional regulator with XRE-family HTH domain
MGRETNDRTRTRKPITAQADASGPPSSPRAAGKKAKSSHRANGKEHGDNPSENGAAGDQAGDRAVGRAVGRAADIWLGQQLRALRKGRELSLTDLAERTGLSIGNISQIERGVSSPSVRSLKKLGEALQVSVGDLFQETDLPPAKEMAYIVRRKTRPLLNLADTGVQKELLTPTTPGALQMLLVTIQPGGSSGPEHYTHRGEEAGLVLSGALELWIEEDRFILKEGDTFRFKSTQPHRFGNAGAKVTTVLWVTTPPGY